MKEWRYIKPLATEDLIAEVESKLDYKFSDSYINFVKSFNGGRPPVSSFMTIGSEERSIKSFLSLNPTDPENIVKLNKGVAEISAELVAFAIDEFGNYLCFDKGNDSVLFLDFELGETEPVAMDFSSFLSKIE